jgi:hypothetical protein
MVPDHTYLTWSTHSNLSCSGPQSWAGSLLLRKRAPNIIHSTSADWSVSSYPVSLPSQSIKQWGAKPTFCWWLTTRFTGPISPACDRYVQYLLAGANPSVLNRHRRGLQPWRCRIFTLHSLTFPTVGPPLSTYGPRPVSSLTKNLTHDPRFKFKKTYGRHVAF